MIFRNVTIPWTANGTLRYSRSLERPLRKKSTRIRSTFTMTMSNHIHLLQQIKGSANWMNICSSSLPYSLDLVPLNFQLFSPIEDSLQGQQFNDTDLMKVADMKWVKQCMSEFFQRGFENWNEKGHKMYHLWWRHGEYYLCIEIELLYQMCNSNDLWSVNHTGMLIF